MRRLIVVSALVVLFYLPAARAQEVETPKAELFGGYSYGGSGTHGWNVSVAGNVNSWFGLVADFNGFRTRLREQDSDEKIRSYSYLFGPQFSLRRSRAVRPFVHALFGGARTRNTVTEAGQNFVFTDTTFAMALGGGLDVRVNDAVAIRVIQANYLRTGFFGETQNKGRISAGLVIRFGKK
ncbi:MAG: outer membrane beta-barrel protein [Pyrinomonadaceae bacterium]|nr:outer membrane beta-barrel protein [Pyrinomonadaceae bacterium]